MGISRYNKNLSVIPTSAAQVAEDATTSGATLRPILAEGLDEEASVDDDDDDDDEDEDDADDDDTESLSDRAAFESAAATLPGASVAEATTSAPTVDCPAILHPAATPLGDNSAGRRRTGKGQNADDAAGRRRMEAEGAGEGAVLIPAAVNF